MILIVILIKNNWRKIALAIAIVAIAFLFIQKPVYAQNVSGAVEGAWGTAKGQIKSVVTNVVFPAINIVLAVFFFIKLGTAYFDYRKHGQFEWAAPAILFACLCFMLTATTFISQIVSW